MDLHLNEDEVVVVVVGLLTFSLLRFLLLETWRWTDIGMGRKDSILYRTV
jgi:hypothetical protein